MANITNPNWDIKELKKLIKVNQLNENETMFLLIKNYAEDANCHFGKFNLIRIIEFTRLEPNLYFTGGTNRMLLWHGTKRGHLESIINNHFVLPPQTQRLMFGSGIYFADRASKSAQYCGDSKPGYLLLCDVDLGTSLHKIQADNDLIGPPMGYDSIFAVGQNQPMICDNVNFDENVIIPCGTTIQNEEFRHSKLKYNEYIVYNVERICIKYLVEVDF